MRKKVKQFFKFQPFSQKQRKVLNWWCSTSPVKDAEGIIADGAIWKDGEHVTIFRYVGDEQFQRTKLRDVWKDDRLLPT